MKNFGKYFLLILAFLSIGTGSTYGNTLPEIREEQPISSEDLKAASAASWAYRGNQFQKISDLSENHFFGSISAIFKDFSYSERLSEKTSLLGHKRDLRKIIFQQIFPKHFFL